MTGKGLRRRRAELVHAAPPSGVPVYTGAAGQTLVFTGDASLGYYSSPTNAGLAVDPAVARFVPGPSPYVDGGAVDLTRCFLPAGKGGVGKAVQIKYLAGAGSDAQFPHWYLVNSGVADGNTVTVFSGQVMIAGTAPLSIGSYLTSKFMQALTGGTGDQLSIKDKYPTEDFFPNYSGGVFTVWQPVGPTGYQSDATGDVASQPRGPYPYLLDTYHRFCFARKPNSTGALKDGYIRLWLNGARTANAWIKVVDISTGGITDTPVGALKPYCSANMVNNSFNTTNGVSNAFSFSLGGDTSALLTEEWSIFLNLGNANPLSADTFVMHKQAG